MKLKIIDPVIHNLVDYLLVLIFWLSPSVFSFSGTVALVLYILGFSHLFITICTNSPFGMLRFIPLKVHGWLELGMGFIMMISPWVLNYSENILGRNFCIGSGIIMIVFWGLSNYKYATKKL